MFFSRKQSKTVTLLLSAEDESELFIRFEPLGPEYTLMGSDHLKIEATTPAADPIQFICGEGYVTVWAAPFAKVRASNAAGDALEFLT